MVACSTERRWFKMDHQEPNAHTELSLRQGRIWERRFFGCTTDDFPTPIKTSWDNALRYALNSQMRRRWDPSAPKTQIAGEAFECARSYIDPKWAGELRLYCALGTALDWYYGADGFFAIGETVVCIDLTCQVKPPRRRRVLFTRDDCIGNRLWHPCNEVVRLFDELLKND